MTSQNKRYELDETNRRRMNRILGKALSIGSVMYTVDEKKAVDQLELKIIVSLANQILELTSEIANDIGVKIGKER